MCRCWNNSGVSQCSDCVFHFVFVDNPKAALSCRATAPCASKRQRLRRQPSSSFTAQTWRGARSLCAWTSSPERDPLMRDSHMWGWRRDVPPSAALAGMPAGVPAWKESPWSACKPQGCGARLQALLVTSHAIEALCPVCFAQCLDSSAQLQQHGDSLGHAPSYQTQDPYAFLMVRAPMSYECRVHV